MKISAGFRAVAWTDALQSLLMAGFPIRIFLVFDVYGNLLKTILKLSAGDSSDPRQNTSVCLGSDPTLDQLHYSLQSRRFLLPASDPTNLRSTIRKPRYGKVWQS
ncbi:MAG: hypothetical protein M2R45_01032 [Verrucomicrobia subdivision 3 bacterium]|nr:hypothetical protein [Limisphaerales bacterium]MCS1414144.1 hypothetical protein [Limisphaerales bacterium]